MSLRKTQDARGNFKVTFDLPSDVGATEVALCGDFNDWSADAHQMKRRKDGRFSTTITLPAGREYRFRYLLDHQRWENDWAADDYVPNEFGGDDSVLRLTDGAGSGNGSSSEPRTKEESPPPAAASSPGAAAANDSGALDAAPEPNEPA